MPTTMEARARTDLSGVGPCGPFAHMELLASTSNEFSRRPGYAPGMSLDVLFILDPIAALDTHKDSTYVLITEALRRGYRPFAVELAGLSLHRGEPRARAFPVALADGQDGAPLAQAGPVESRVLGSFAAALMRKDPPVDDAYVAATWILQRAVSETLVINDPEGLRSINEKLAILDFPELTPPTLITRDHGELRAFLQELGGTMIVKPVYGFGGREILMAREDDPNLVSILEIATGEGSRWTVAQAYIPQATAGDKRILLVDGEPIGAVLRVAASGELRSNFHAGGSPQATELDDRDRAICSEVGPYLQRQGQFFAGLDVIGGLLTEINVTSPTGMQEVNRLERRADDETTQARFWSILESKLGLGDRS